MTKSCRAILGHGWSGVMRALLAVPTAASADAAGGGAADGTG